MLDQKPAGAGDGKSLAFGGLTHRRPPSLNLYRKGAEVPVGDDYTGKELQVVLVQLGLVNA